MRELGLCGAVHSKPVGTTLGDKAADCPAGPREPAIAASKSQCAVGVRFYLGFVGDSGLWRWRGLSDRRLARQSHRLCKLRSRGLQQALYDRDAVHRGGPVQHSGRGRQYASIKYTERLREAGIEPSAAASVIPATMRSPKRSTVHTRRRSSTDAAHGVTSRPSNRRPSTGSTITVHRP
jgi:putative transposase